MKLLDEELHTYNTLHNTTGQVVGGDWNTIPNPHLDKSHNRTNQGLQGSKALQDLVRSHTLVDIWRDRNPDEPGYTRLSDGVTTLQVR